jgi:hypothetical protein
MSDISGGLRYKSISEKVKEATTILDKLLKLGVPDYEPGYVALKERFNIWIKSNDSWSGDIWFPNFGRKAEVILPTKPGRVASIHLLKPVRPY